jgi:hypothetical protein
MWGCLDNPVPTEITALEAPSNLGIRVQSSSRLLLRWTDNATAEDAYRIERQAAGGEFEVIAVTGSNVTSFADRGLAPSTTYLYRLCACQGAAASDYSNERAALTFAPSPADGAGNALVVGAAEYRGAINPGRGQDALIYFQGSDSGRFVCRIYDLAGDLVWEDALDGVVEGVFRWPARDAASGGYIAVIKGPGINVLKKIAVVR